MIQTRPTDQICNVADGTTYSENELPTAFKMEKVRQFGCRTLSYSAALQKGLKHFANNQGFLAFQKKSGHTFVLGDPITSPKESSRLIDQFLAEHSNVTFCQISQTSAMLLSKRGYWINELGFDTILKLDDYDFFGQTKGTLSLCTQLAGSTRLSFPGDGLLN